jgi:hypothetical protein
VAARRTTLPISQDLVEQLGFASYSSLRRFVRRLRGARSPEAHPVLGTAPGEDHLETGVMSRCPSAAVASPPRPVHDEA